MKFLSLILFFLFCQNVFSQEILIEEETLKNPITLSPEQNYVINLDKSYFIDHIVVSVEGIVKDTMIEVLIDGKVKGTIYAPGSDPQYVVTIREVNSRIKLRYLSGAKAKVWSVKIYRSESGFDSVSTWPLVSKSEASNFATKVILISKNLESLISTQEFNTYLLPTKIAAGQLQAIANAHGDSSMKTMEKFQALYLTMSFATPYIDGLLKKTQTFDLAVQFIEKKEQIKDMLDI
jgi:hypothetical protein